MNIRVTQRITETIETEVTLPAWIEFTIQGRKLDAIRAIRECAGLDAHGELLSLKQAKLIVESINFRVDFATLTKEYE